MGGYAGLAQGMGFANEHQGDGTPHGHGFVSLANAYQHATLEDIAALLEQNGKKAAQEDMVRRIIKLNTHLQKEEHFDNDQHQRNLSDLEESFHQNNSSKCDALKLGVRLPDMGNSSNAVFMWHAADGCNTDGAARLKDEALLEAERYRKQFEQEVQCVFSRVQHHWHLKDHKGERVPMKYCRMRSKNKGCVTCKMGFPK